MGTLATHDALDLAAVAEFAVKLEPILKDTMLVLQHHTLLASFAVLPARCAVLLKAASERHDAVEVVAVGVAALRVRESGPPRHVSIPLHTLREVERRHVVHHGLLLLVVQRSPVLPQIVGEPAKESAHAAEDDRKIPPPDTPMIVYTPCKWQTLLLTAWMLSGSYHVPSFPDQYQVEMRP